MFCRHTGQIYYDVQFLDNIQALRVMCGFPLIGTSGYRSPQHPIEAKKAQPGAHSSGQAADFAVQGEQALIVVKHAMALGFTGIGVNQKGSGRFIHVDTIEKGTGHFVRPTIWSY